MANNPIRTKDEVKSAVQDAAAGATEKAREMASNVADKARDVASSVGQKAEDAASSVGGGMASLAGTIRENAPREGMLGSAAASVADTLESGGRYLQEEGFGGMADDLTDLIRRNPIPAVLVGIGLGFLLARSTRS
jgi:hypothetical protein